MTDENEKPVDNVVELSTRNEPPIRTRNYSCGHYPLQLIIDLTERTVECGRCKQVLDPIEAFEILCRNQYEWRRAADAKRQYEDLERRIVAKKKELAKLQYETRKAKKSLETD